MNNEQLLAYVKKYSGHWYLKTDDDRINHVISFVRGSFIIKDNEWTKGYLEACTRMKDLYEELKKEEEERKNGSSQA